MAPAAADGVLVPATFVPGQALEKRGGDAELRCRVLEDHGVLIERIAAGQDHAGDVESTARHDVVRVQRPVGFDDRTLRDSVAR